MDHEGLPPLLTRGEAAEIVSQHYFTVSPQTLRSWPIQVVHVDGRRALLPLADVVAEAERRVLEAPQVAAAMAARMAAARRAKAERRAAL
jgi:hypothetical protein